MPRGFKRYDEVLEYLENYFRVHNKMPTIKHAEYELGMRPGVMTRVLQGLEREGKLVRNYAMPYALRF